jgi:predicted Zn-dependent protease
VNRTWALFLCLVALIAGWVAYSRMYPLASSAAASLPPRVEGSKIYFVPFGDFPTGELDSLESYCRGKYGLEVEILRTVPIDSGSLDESRQQVIAERLISNMRDAFPEHANDPKAILIGFTSEDMYLLSKNWQFAFGWREASSRAAIVSTARLKIPAGTGLFDLDRETTRLHKVVAKDIGILYYGMHQSSDPKSVLYNQIMGIEELDATSEDF